MNRLVKNNFSDKCPIAEMGFTQRVGCYLLSVKVGNYYEFNSFAHSNQRHFHGCYELVMVINGFGEIEHEGVKHRLDIGDLYISSPYESHELHIKPSESMGVFYVFFELSSEGGRQGSTMDERIITEFVLRHRPYRQNNKEMLAYSHFIDTYGEGSSSGKDPWLVKHLMNFILQSMERLSYREKFNTPNSGEYVVTTFEVVLDYIDEHIEKELNASELAEVIGVSRRTLYKMFEKNMNRTVHDYIKEKKIEYAKIYLMKNLPVGEVAGLVGFQSASYFSRLFKGYVGESPRAYVKNSQIDPKGLGRRMT